MSAVLITGGGGQLARAVIDALPPGCNIILIVRRGSGHLVNGFLPRAIEIIEIDMLTDGWDEVLAQKLSALPLIQWLVNVAADTGFHMFSHEALGRSRLAQDQLLVNLVGPVLCTAAVFESQWKDRPLERPTAKVLNISSVSGKRPFFGTRQCFYAASKAGLNMMTMYMAQEYLPYNIHVNGFSPDRLSSTKDLDRCARAVGEILKSSVVGKIFELSQIKDV